MSQSHDAASGTTGNPWAVTGRVLSDRTRWAVTIICCLAVGLLVGAAIALTSLWLGALAVLVWWFLAVVVTGYRALTPEQAAALHGTALWHLTRTRAWPTLPEAGEVITFSPKRCRFWSLMHRDHLRPHLPRKAVYVTRRHPILMPAWGLPSRRRRDLTLTLELADPALQAGTFSRVDGAIAFTAETRLRVVAVNVKEQP